MSDSDKWTARRGSQGDDWRWEGEPPPEPESTTSPSGGESMFSGRAEKPRRRLPAIRLTALLAAVAAFFVAAAVLIARPFRQVWARATERRSAGEARDFTRFAAVLSVFTLIAAVALLIALLISVTGDDDGTSPPTGSPTATAGETPGRSETPAPTTSPTEEPTPQPSATPSPGVLVPPGPEGNVSLGLWANELSAWWFGTLPEGSAVYHPGDEIPWMLRWDADPGAAYVVQITYDCRAGDVPLIDLLTGVEYAHDDIFLAEWGPGTTRPESAVPIPDTADSEIDDAAPGLLYLYGGTFSLLPDGPDPAASCQDVRTITASVRATGNTMILMGSAWLAQPEDHNGTGAADATSTVGIKAEIEGAGGAQAGVMTGVIKP